MTGKNSPSALRIWLWACRPRTLPLGASAVALGYGLALMRGRAAAGVFILALLTAVLLQILSNLANDYGDAVAGADTKDRLGPVRLVGSGLTTPQKMFRAMIFSTLLAAGTGSALLLLAAWGNPALLLGFALLGAASVAAAIFYTVGKRPYGYYGLGDLMAGLFFGPVPVWGTALLCGADPGAYLFLPGLAAGLCSTMVLNVNNMRDINTDAKTGKRTVAVRLGLDRARQYHSALCALVFLSWGFFWFTQNPAYLPGLLLCLPLAASARMAVTKAEDAANMNRQLKNTVLSSALCSGGMGFLCALAG